MTKGEALGTGALSIVLIGVIGRRLYIWITTGQLASRFHPEGEHVSFANDPIGFVLGIGSNGLGILCAVILLLTALTAE